jgi:hypothetical protein
LESYANQSQLGAYPPEKTIDKPHTVLMRDALGEAHNLANEANALITNLTERLFGSAPTNNVGQAAGLQAIPNGVADEMAYSTRGLVSLLRNVRDAASRLEARL